MFNGLIAKSVIRDNIHILIPNDLIDNDKLVLISHGSGGLGTAEYTTAEYFLSHGYRVGLLDYFSKYNINNLWWNYEERFRDNHSISFETMLTDFVLPTQYKIVHIGFSLGGFLGIINSEKFYKNYCFYPGIVGFNEHLVNKDYSNTTVFIANKDEWCDYSGFESNCLMPPNRVNIDAYHGFMIPDKDKIISVAKYNTPKTKISNTEFYNLKPCHSWLEMNYGYEPKNIRLLYNKNECILCLSQILDELK